MKTQPGKFTQSGDGLCVGFDSGDAVSQQYQTPGEFKGGRSRGSVSLSRRPHMPTSSKKAQRALMRD